MNRSTKRAPKEPGEVIGHAKRRRGASGTLLSSLREAHDDIAAYLAGDASRVVTTTVMVTTKSPAKRRKSAVRKG